MCRAGFQEGKNTTKGRKASGEGPWNWRDEFRNEWLKLLENQRVFNVCVIQNGCARVTSASLDHGLVLKGSHVLGLKGSS